MVLKPLSDPREMLDCRDSKTPEFGFVAETRLQQDLRRVYRTKRQNHLAPSANATSAAFIRNLDAGGSVALES
jgi:UV DNA damage repair endonuclease